MTGATARGALATLAWASLAASLLAGAVAVAGVRAARLDWRFALHDLLGVATPGLAAVGLAAALAGCGWSLAVAPRAPFAASGGAALLAAATLLGWAAWRAEARRQALVFPALHDVATDWREPLMPTAALVARRGRGAAPIEAAPALGEGPRGGFLGRPVAEVNAATCPQAAPLALPVAPAAAYARLRAAVLAQGWRLVTDDPSRGRLEAEAPAPVIYGGRADVLARVRPRGAGAAIDLRSISRHGEGDGGTNCRRVAALLTRLAI